MIKKTVDDKEGRIIIFLSHSVTVNSNKYVGDSNRVNRKIVIE